MAGKERRRVQATQNAIAVGANGDTSISMEDTVNVHSMRVSCSIEPDAADANAHGTWALVVRIEEGGVLISPTIANLNAENLTQGIWALGTWACSNQSPYNFEIAPKTSRNISKGGDVFFRINNQGLTAGNLIASTTMTCFVRQI